MTDTIDGHECVCSLVNIDADDVIDHVSSTSSKHLTATRRKFDNHSSIL